MSRYYVDIKEKAQFDLLKLLKDEPAYYKKSHEAYCRAL